MSVYVRVEGEKFIDLVDEIQDETIGAAKELAAQGGDLLLADVKRRLKSRSGQPAPAGESPAYQSGELHNSFRRLPVKVKENTVTSGIRSSEDYGKVGAPEFGYVSANGKQVKARPFLRPAEQAIQPELDKLAESLL